MKSILISSFIWISRLWHGNCVRAKNLLQSVRNDGGSVGISQFFCQLGPCMCANAHTETDRILYACLSGSIEPKQGWRWLFPGSNHYQWWDVMSPLWARAKSAVHSVTAYKLTIEEKADEVMCGAFCDRIWMILLDFPGTWTNHQLWPQHHDTY